MEAAVRLHQHCGRQTNLPKQKCEIKRYACFNLLLVFYLNLEPLSRAGEAETRVRSRAAQSHQPRLYARRPPHRLSAGPSRGRQTGMADSRSGEMRLPVTVEPQARSESLSEPSDRTDRVERTDRVLPWWRGWTPLLVLPVAVVILIAPAWPRWAVMWALAFAIYVGCKWLTWRRAQAPSAALWRHAGYLLGWPGLDASTFLNPGPIAPTSTGRGRVALRREQAALGVVLLFGGARQIPAEYPYLVGWVGMVGLILTLHFGTFHLLSCAWRRLGVEARPLMNWPLLATSVSDFWGRRGNTAFRDLTHRFLFRPLSRRLGPRWGIGAGFLFSGVVHDLVISVPAGGGYGGPTLFFVLQGAAIFVERTRVGGRFGLGQGWRGWLFTLLLLLATVFVLFHPPFVMGIVVPFLRALRAL